MRLRGWWASPPGCGCRGAIRLSLFGLPIPCMDRCRGWGAHTHTFRCSRRCFPFVVGVPSPFAGTPGQAHIPAEVGRDRDSLPVDSCRFPPKARMIPSVVHVGAFLVPTLTHGVAHVVVSFRLCLAAHFRRHTHYDTRCQVGPSRHLCFRRSLVRGVPQTRRSDRNMIVTFPSCCFLSHVRRCPLHIQNTITLGLVTGDTAGHDVVHRVAASVVNG